MFRRFLVLLPLLWLTACGEPAVQPGESLQEIRVGVLPHRNAEELAQRMAPLLDHLAANVGIPHSLVIPEDYSHLVELFGEGKIDLAIFGGYSFVRASEEFGAVPLVMRDIDRQFVSYILVSTSDDAVSIEDLVGDDFSFGSSLSTSGHLMPRFFLAQQGIEPESFFSTVEYSGAHDKTALSVATGKVRAGAVNAQIVEQMFASGDLSADEVRILWHSPPYADYVWAVQQEMSQELSAALRDAFLALSGADSSHRQILSQLGADYFLPAQLADFADLSNVVLDYEASTVASLQ